MALSLGYQLKGCAEYIGSSTNEQSIVETTTEKVLL